MGTGIVLNVDGSPVLPDRREVAVLRTVAVNGDVSFSGWWKNFGSIDV
jgi:hypothetical protein